MQDASTQQKQRFLRQQILEANYDPGEFVQFLRTDLKIQELDVEHMEMKILQSAVNKFKQYKYYQLQGQSPSPSPEMTQKHRKIQYEKSGVTNIFDYEFQGTLKCIQIEPFTKKLQVYVPNVQVLEKSGIFFSKTEVWFIVKANLNRHPVRRLEEDFDWLSNTITKLYPLLAIPELVPVSRQHQGNHDRRRKELEQYLQILASKDEMRRANVLFQFLTFPPEKMEKMKKNYDSMSFVKSIHSIKNETGSLDIKLNNKLRDYALSTEKMIRRIPRIHEGISQSLQKVMEHLSTTSKEIYKIVDYFAELHELYNQITNKSPQFKIDEYSEILININNLFHAFANDLVTKEQTLHSSLKDFSKIELNLDKSIYKVFKEVYSTEKQYVVFKGNLNRKKQRLYPDVTKWQVDEKSLQNRRLSQEQAFEMMLPRETGQQNQQKRWLAYLYCNFRDEFKYYLTYQAERYSDVYCTFCSQLLLNNKNYVQQITKFIQESKKEGKEEPKQ